MKLLQVVLFTLVVGAAGCRFQPEEDPAHEMVTGYFINQLLAVKTTQPSVQTGYKDNADGTVTDFDNKLVWARCIQATSAQGGTLYNSADNSCSGSGKTAGTFNYCDEADNDCNGGVDNGILDGNPNNYATGLITPGVSQAWSSCNGLALAGRKWRVATAKELETILIYAVTTMNLTLFPLPNGSALGQHWTSTSYDAGNAFYANFTTTPAVAKQPKTAGPFRLRCVSSL